jgi:REP element-mobilizing transposase RayT
MKVLGAEAVYHCMTHTVTGMPYFDMRAKEVLRKMIWQVAAFSGVEVLTYCVMSNHFHVLVRVPEAVNVSDAELLRRYQILYPKPTKFQTASIAQMAKDLAAGGEAAEAIRQKLLVRMGDISQYMKALKQRFSVWYNRSHQRTGTLWNERFKSVLVEGRGNPLQTMAAYIDLNPVRAGLVQDPKDYRFCGYAEAVAEGAQAAQGLRLIWAAYANGSARSHLALVDALQMHRSLIFGQRASDPGISEMEHRNALKILEQQDAVLPKSTVLRCRVRYFSDGAILGSQEFVRGFVDVWQFDKGRKYPPQVHPLRGADWEGLSCIQGLRKAVFS